MTNTLHRGRGKNPSKWKPTFYYYFWVNGHALAFHPARFNNWRRKLIYITGLFFYLPKLGQLLSRKNGRRQEVRLHLAFAKAKCRNSH